MVDMAGRDPMFGRPLRAPYGGGTGHSQDGPSQQRQEHQDEHGISKHRQQVVLGFLYDAGPIGMTIHELCEKTNWHHGQASNALSVLDTAGDVVRLEETRGEGGQSVYTLEQFMEGRTRARRRRSSAEKLAEVEARLAAMTERESQTRKALQDATVNLTQAGDTLRESSAALAEMQQQLNQETARRQAAERDCALAEQSAAFSVERLEQMEAELNRMTRENAARRVEHHLRTALEPDEAAVVRRIGGMLPTVAARPDDETVKVSLLVIRTLMQVVQRSTRLPDDPAETPDT